MPTSGDLFRAYCHLLYCAQSQFTAYHVLNWLFLVVPTNMWNMHLVDAYPTAPVNPALAPNYGTIGTPLAIINAKDTYNNGNKNFQEDVNMNRALTECFFVAVFHQTRTGLLHATYTGPRTPFR